FMADQPGHRFSKAEDVNGFKVSVVGENNGQAMVIHPSGHDFLLIGYRTKVVLQDAVFHWPGLGQVRVERVRWDKNHWASEQAPSYGFDQSSHTLAIELEDPQAVRVSW